MWQQLFNTPLPDSRSILPEDVQIQAAQRIRQYWKANGWWLLLGELVLWASATIYETYRDHAYGVVAMLIALTYLLGWSRRWTLIWLMATPVLFMLQGMVIKGLGAVTALTYIIPYTFAGMLLNGRKRVLVQSWCILTFWGSLIYEILPFSPQLQPPTYILVSYDILLAVFIFQTLRFLNHLTVEINTAYVAEQVRQQSQQFLARVSHELRTPLNSVLGFAKLLRRADLHETQSHYLHQIIDESEQLNHLVSDLLDSAHLSTGKLKLELSDVDVNAVCEAVAEQHRPTLPPTVTLKLDLSAHLPTLAADPVRLRQAVANLVANAVKHTERGTITIATQQRDSRLCISVTDTGRGIPEDQQKLIFVPFVQLDNRSAGVGLGLDIAAQLIKLHGGEIHLDSTVGQGSTFTIELPTRPNDSAES